MWSLPPPDATADETLANQPQPWIQLCHRHGKSMNGKKQQAASSDCAYTGDLTLDALHLISPPMNGSLARAIFFKWRRRREAWRRRARLRAHA